MDGCARAALEASDKKAVDNRQCVCVCGFEALCVDYSGTIVWPLLLFIDLHFVLIFCSALIRYNCPIYACDGVDGRFMHEQCKMCLCEVSKTCE